MSTTPFGYLLKRHREERGHTQKKFAALCGLSESYLSRIETGICSPTSEALLDRVATALSLSEQDKEALRKAAQKSQRIIQLPSNLSIKGFLITRRFLDTVAMLDHQDLEEIRRICAKHSPEEDLCLINK
jgi:transcriptional regulator with XRE-family HTH domain